MPVTSVALSTSGGTTNLTGTVTVTAVPTPGGQVVNVKFYVDSVLAATDTSAPYNFAWDTVTVAQGVHELKAVATFQKFQTAEQKLSVTVLFQGGPPPPPPPPPPPGIPVKVTEPVISGTATEGQLLMIRESTSDWTNSPTSYTHQWSRCDAAGANGVPIPSADRNNYTLGPADVGSTIRCWTTAFNTSGGSVPTLSAQTAVVAALAPSVPVLITTPVIAGTPTQGQTLTIGNGLWTNSPTSYTHQWIRCDANGENCTSPAGADQVSYLLSSADVGLRMRCWTTAINATGSSTPVRSAATVAVTASVPPPPTGTLGIDRTTMLITGGTILREDTSAQTNPEPGLWGSVEYVFGNCTLVGSGGDTRPKCNGVAQGNTNYRSLTLANGYGGGDVATHREQLGRNERLNGENTGIQTNGTFALFPEGVRRLIFASMRFPAGGILMNQAGFQVIFNFKQTQPYGGNGSLPGNAIEVNLFNNRIDYINFWGSQPGSWTAPAPPFDTWIRFAFDITYSSDPSIGRIQYFVDHNGTGDFLGSTKASPVFSAQTLCTETIGPSGGTYLPIGSSIPCHFRIGVYNDPAYYLNRDNTVHVDNIQVVG